MLLSFPFFFWKDWRPWRTRLFLAYVPRYPDTAPAPPIPFSLYNISFDSYIKPQRFRPCLGSRNVVYLLIPTSNHNGWKWHFVFASLYIFWFLHQTTTHHWPSPQLASCISFDSYIKPQHINVLSFFLCVVYLLIPTSNHNISTLCLTELMLYIFWFLHQTTTAVKEHVEQTSCISFDSYIKPQPRWWGSCGWPCCISFDSYIKPQQTVRSQRLYSVVYLLIPTSNHNSVGSTMLIHKVVYLLIPTSNHNFKPGFSSGSSVVYLLIPTSNHNIICGRCCTFKFYIFCLLHKTTTDVCYTNLMSMLYIFWFLHQTTTNLRVYLARFRCISFDSYIKPQPWPPSSMSWAVVYLLISTSNHNHPRGVVLRLRLYIFWFLHQTTTWWCLSQ